MKVVGIHGISHTHLTAPQIESEWIPAIQGGLEEAFLIWRKKTLRAQPMEPCFVRQELEQVISLD